MGTTSYDPTSTPEALKAARYLVPTLAPSGGLMPVTGGYLAARDEWSSGWSSAVSGFASEIRAVQASVLGNAAEFGGAQLRGFGSARNMDYIAKRWEKAGDQYLTRGRDGYTFSDQMGSTVTITGMHEWIAKQDAAFRALVSREMDAKVAAFVYRAVFLDHANVYLPPMTFTRTRRSHGKVTGQETVTVPARTREYVGSPVASGYSRSRMDLIWIIRGNDLVGQLVSRAPYTLVAPAVRGWWAQVKRRTREPIEAVSVAIAGKGTL